MSRHDKNFSVSQIGNLEEPRDFVRHLRCAVLTRFRARWNLI